MKEISYSFSSFGLFPFFLTSLPSETTSRDSYVSSSSTTEESQVARRIPSSPAPSVPTKGTLLIEVD